MEVGMGLWHDGGVVGFGISGVGGEWRAMARDRAQSFSSVFSWVEGLVGVKGGVEGEGGGEGEGWYGSFYWW